MSAIEAIRLEGGPEIRLLAACDRALDEEGLRGWARSLSDSCVSRSYCYPYALVATYSGPVGVDIERIEACDPAFVDSICTPAERDGQRSETDPDRYATSLWCGKEALAKALGDALLYDPRRLESPLSWPAGRCGAWRAASLPAPPQHVAWVCWR
jgi:phosphopantetheinyl transferase